MVIPSLAYQLEAATTFFPRAYGWRLVIARLLARIGHVASRTYKKIEQQEVTIAQLNKDWQVTAARQQKQIEGQ